MISCSLSLMIRRLKIERLKQFCRYRQTEKSMNMKSFVYPKRKLLTLPKTKITINNQKLTERQNSKEVCVREIDGGKRRLGPYA